MSTRYFLKDKEEGDDEEEDELKEAKELPLPDWLPKEEIMEEYEVDYQPWVFYIKRVARDTKTKIYQLHKDDPQLWTISKLSSDFGLRKDRIRAIIQLEEMAEYENCKLDVAGLQPLDTTLDELWTEKFGESEHGEDLVFPIGGADRHKIIDVPDWFSKSEKERALYASLVRKGRGKGSFRPTDRKGPPEYDPEVNVDELKIVDRWNRSPPNPRKQMVYVDTAHGVPDSERDIRIRQTDGLLRRPNEYERFVYSRMVAPLSKTQSSRWGNPQQEARDSYNRKQFIQAVEAWRAGAGPKPELPEPCLPTQEQMPPEPEPEEEPLPELKVAPQEEAK
eukprot:TRINITY_DN6631_c0_g1_i1.p1 TRINITY_DN6631_c0_g1~~TRINITY_DN6631_c0_g1_i1.p1  ORF type:complete len:392 (-),score=61.38 TRINITY_DN6631_c0_g1_i1:10-1014(-)